MRIPGSLAVHLSAVILLGSTAISQLRADPVADFYSGKTITIITSTGPASTYTTYAQLVADYLGGFIPGKPKIIVQTMPGAGGIRAANYMANTAAKDGTVLATVHETLPIEQVLKADQVRFDMSKFEYIGVMSTITSTLTVTGDAPATTLEGAKSKEVIVASTGAGSITHQLPSLLNNLMGTKFRIVGGYQAMGEMTLAMDRGEVHGRAGSLVGWTQTRPKDVADGKFVHVIQVGLKKDPTLPNVPLLIDLARTDRERMIFEFISSSSLVGRSIFAPPGTPPERLAALRAAFQAMIKDPAFLATAKQRNHDIMPATAEEVMSAIKRTVSIPRDISEEARKAMGE